jgi:hypothetical protein
MLNIARRKERQLIKSSDLLKQEIIGKQIKCDITLTLSTFIYMLKVKTDEEK